MEFLLQNEPLSLIKKVEMEANKIIDVVSLAQWIPWYGVPEPVIENLIDKIRKWFTNRYSIVPGILELREKLALHYLKKYNVELNYENELIITAGAIQWITATLLTILNNEQNEVILIDPSYASYQTCISVARWKSVFSKLDENLDLDIEDIESKINEKTRVVLLCNPNNPTGSIFDFKKIERLLELSQEYDFYVLLDEVYDEFIFEQWKFVSGVKLFEKYKDRLVLLNSWSKSFGMTGWRIGFIVCNPILFHEILKIHDSMITCAPVHSQWSALATFDIVDEWFPKVQKELKERRDYTVDRLNQMKWFLDFNEPEAAYYVFPKFKYTDDDVGECMKLLQEQKVAVVPWSWFGLRWKGHFRICFGRDFPDLEEGLDRIENFFK